MSDAPPRALAEADIDPDGTRAEWYAQMLRQGVAEDSMGATLAECFEFLLANVDAWEAGEITPADLPGFDQDAQWLILQCVMFGTLWELTHPHLWAVLDAEGRLIGLYGHEANAEARADNEAGWTVCRQSVADGDQPPEAILGGDAV